MEDKVRMVGVRRWLVHTRVDPTWANPRHPPPLSVPPRPSLPGFPASGTARVPAPLRKRRAIRRVRKRPRCRVYAPASTTLLPMLDVIDETFTTFACLLYTYPQAAVKRCPACAFSPFEQPHMPLTRATRRLPEPLWRCAGCKELWFCPWDEASGTWHGLRSLLASLLLLCIIGSLMGGRTGDRLQGGAGARAEKAAGCCG